MKNKLPEEIPIVDLKQRVSDFVESYPGGHEALAAILNIRLPAFRNRFNEKTVPVISRWVSLKYWKTCQKRNF